MATKGTPPKYTPTIRKPKGTAPVYNAGAVKLPKGLAKGDASK